MTAKRWTAGKSFAVGGLGCLVALVLLGVCAVTTGGFFYANFGGIIIVFLIGGVVGLIGYAVYSKGARDAGGVERPPGLTRSEWDELRRKADRRPRGSAYEELYGKPPPKDEDGP